MKWPSLLPDFEHSKLSENRSCLHSDLAFSGFWMSSFWHSTVHSQDQVRLVLRRTKRMLHFLKYSLKLMAILLLSVECPKWTRCKAVASNLLTRFDKDSEKKTIFCNLPHTVSVWNLNVPILAFLQVVWLQYNRTPEIGTI